jgi:predicted transcriptional regulator YdeE
MFLQVYQEGFSIIGISVVTSNDGSAGADLGQLWSRFYEEAISGKIPNLVDERIFSVYTDYESDYTGTYTCIIGMKVSSLDEIPEGMIGRSFESSEFLKTTAKGPMPDALFNTWEDIWDKDGDLARAYAYDYEVYGERSLWGGEAEVDLYLSI